LRSPPANFGNICAGHRRRAAWVCRFKRLVLGKPTRNDVLDEFFRTGTYRVPQQAPRRIENVEPVDGHFQGRRTSSVSCSTCWAAMAPKERSSCSRTEVPKTTARSRSARTSSKRIVDHGFVSGQAAPTPTASQRFATPGQRFGSDDRHAHRRWPQGGARGHLDLGVPMIVSGNRLGRPSFAETIVEAIGPRARNRAGGHAAGIEQTPQAIQGDAGRCSSGSRPSHRRECLRGRIL